MRILIVDDSKTIRHVLGSLLKELGYNNIIEAENVEKAKQLSKNTPPSLIISDWNMPGATGLDLLKFVKSQPETANVPFIMLTTETDRAKIVEATRAGLQSYLLKPIKKQILVEKLQELAAAYGFKPPLGTPATPEQPVPTAVTEHPFNGLIKKEQVASILDAYRKVWQMELSVSEFESYVKEDVFSGYPAERSADLDLLLKTIQDAGREGILNRLITMV